MHLLVPRPLVLSSDVLTLSPLLLVAVTLMCAPPMSVWSAVGLGLSGETSDAGAAMTTRGGSSPWALRGPSRSAHSTLVSSATNNEQIQY